MVKWLQYAGFFNQSPPRLQGLQPGRCQAAAQHVPGFVRAQLAARRSNPHSLYLLVMTNIANWKITIFNGKIHHFNGDFP